MSEVDPYPTLSHPPIKEAIIDIRVHLADELESIDALKLDDATLEELMLDQGNPIVEMGVTFGLNASIPPERIQHLVGMEYRSLDNSLVIRLHPGGCSVHQLHGYVNWQTFSRIGKSIWNHFDAHTGDKDVQRLGLRYLNAFKFPSPFGLHEHFNFYLVAPENLPYHWGPRFTTNFSIHDIDREYACLVNLSYFLNAEDKEVFDAYLDLDASKMGGIEVAKLWETFDGLRAFKNEIFFSSIKNSLLDQLN